MARAEYLFEQGVTAINTFGLAERVYVCPICAISFDDNALSERYLTKEHAPPRSAGGRALLLTCKGCNGLAGSQYDNQPVARMEYLNAMEAIFSNGTSGVSAVELSIDDVRVNATLSKKDTTTNLGIDRRHNDPRIVEKFHNKLASAADGLKINLKYRSDYIARRASISDLKSCFIVLTAKFGYSYALHDTLSKIRDQLRQPDKDIHSHVYTKNEGLPENSIFVSEKYGVAIVRLLGNAHIMPWISHDYEHFQLHKASGLKFTAPGAVFPFPKNFEAILDRSGKHGLTMRIVHPAGGAS